MTWVTLAAIIAAILSGIDLVQGARGRAFSLVVIAVFILSLALALSGLGVIDSIGK